jgi:hypothetical protein
MLHDYWGEWQDGADTVDHNRSYERPRLNERFIYLLFFSGYIGVVQGIQHVASDRARLVFPEDTVCTLIVFFLRLSY